LVAGASVAAEVLDHKRGPKVISFKKRRRKNSKRKRGYRDELTMIRITEILADGKAPTIGPRPKREKPVVAAPVDGDEAPAKKAPAKKAAAPKAAAAKPAAAKKPAAKKKPAAE
jgi:large subunit ribosomal protein L21